MERHSQSPLTPQDSQPQLERRVAEGFANCIGERIAELGPAGMRELGGDRREGAIHSYQREFAEQHSIVVPRLIAPEVLADVQTRLDTATFSERSDGDESGHWSRELVTDDAFSLAILHLVTNDPAFWKLVRAITGCGEINRFVGRIYRMLPGGDHYDSWHDDVGFERLLTMSINLSPNLFRGGELEMRSAASKEIVRTVANTGPGDALIFRVDPLLHHRVRNVEGEASKTAFVGWFSHGEGFAQFVRGRSQTAQTR